VCGDDGPAAQLARDVIDGIVAEHFPALRHCSPCFAITRQRNAAHQGTDRIRVSHVIRSDAPLSNVTDMAPAVLIWLYHNRHRPEVKPED
jgi:hypothetical protein